MICTRTPSMKEVSPGRSPEPQVMQGKGSAAFSQFFNEVVGFSDS